MSDVLQAAKTREYVKEDIVGQDGKLVPNSGDKLSYVTAQEIPGKRIAMDVLIHGVTVQSTGHIIEAGSVQRRIVSTAHGAKAGQFMRPTSGNSVNEEIPITKVIDANTFVIAAPFDLSLADTFEIVRTVTPNYTAAGDLNVVVSGSGPIEFNLDGVSTVVSEDTVAPVNSNPLPSKMFIEVDGVMYPVRKDTSVPANTVSVPVEITGASGPINITAGDLNVQLSDQGPNADVTRVGDGTNQWGMNASKEGLVHDADALAELVDINVDTSDIADSVASIDTKTPALVGGNVPVVMTGVSTEAKQDAQITSFGTRTDTMATDYFGNFSFMALVKRLGLYLSSIDTQMVGKATEATLSAINTKTPSLGQALAASSVPVVLPALQLSAIASETTLAAMSAKLPASLGTKTSALSLSVTGASDAVFRVSSTPTGTSTFATQTVVHGAVSTFTVPANAKRMVVYNNADATAANRIRRGNAAAAPNWATSTGPILGVGSFTSELPASTFTCIAENADSSANISVEYFY